MQGHIRKLSHTRSRRDSVRICTFASSMSVTQLVVVCLFVPSVRVRLCLCLSVCRSVCLDCLSVSILSMSAWLSLCPCMIYLFANVG